MNKNNEHLTNSKRVFMKILKIVILFIFISCPNESEIQIKDTVATPIASIPSGTYNTVQYVTLSTATNGASIKTLLT